MDAILFLVFLAELITYLPVRPQTAILSPGKMLSEMFFKTGPELLRKVSLCTCTAFNGGEYLRIGCCDVLDGDRSNTRPLLVGRGLSDVIILEALHRCGSHELANTRNSSKSSLENDPVLDKRLHRCAEGQNVTQTSTNKSRSDLLAKHGSQDGKNDRNDCNEAIGNKVQPGLHGSQKIVRLERVVDQSSVLLRKLVLPLEGTDGRQTVESLDQLSVQRCGALYVQETEQASCAAVHKLDSGQHHTEEWQKSSHVLG